MIKPILQPRSGDPRQYLTIAQLNQRVKGLLEREFSAIWVQGEISNFVQPASGHWYFTLKDDKAQVKCTMWRGKNQRLGFQPSNGQQVYARVKVSLYEPRGDYQVNVEFIEPAGLGSLQAQFEQLKRKLESAGLFSSERKRMLPTNSQKIGVITSPTGAAIKDFLQVAARRSPATEIIIYPCQVQGKTAHQSINQALQLANQRSEVDLLVLTRGGGSMEDLWCFNDESLAYAIAQSGIPIVSAVGHEIDFTIADFVADMRAPTPSAAAELVTTDQAQLIQHLDNLAIDLLNLITGLIDNQTAELQYLTLKLTNPEPLLSQYDWRIKHLAETLSNRINKQLMRHQQRLEHSKGELIKLEPREQLHQLSERLTRLNNRMQQSYSIHLQRLEKRFIGATSKLNSLSPLATLERGYSITLADDRVIKSVADVEIGQTITTKLNHGVLTSRITSTNES